MFAKGYNNSRYLGNTAMRHVLLSFVLVLIASIVGAQSLTTSAGAVKITKMLGGLDEPWAIGFLPDGSYLVTERGGKLLRVADGAARSVAGVPKLVVQGQGGLLDVMIPRDFATSRQVFVSYARRQGRGAGTALAVGRLSADGRRLEETRTIFEAAVGGTGGRHFGSRIVEARDGTLFVTLGERGDRPSAQDRSNHNGTIVRINRDDSVPGDNPFVGQAGVQPEIWSWGHRNPQGAALDLRGELWTAEHGAKGGDEVNRIRKGANYGWPVISYGRHYSGAKIGEGTAKPGLQQPAFYWDPSIAPSGLMIYSGRLWPDWRGDFFVGSLKFDYLSRLDGSPLQEREQIRHDATQRVRDVVEAPDGSIWFISVGKDAIYRMSPG
jgi:glucose/arabinose dehydrogenase